MGRGFGSLGFGACSLELGGVGLVFFGWSQGYGVQG